MSTYTSKYLQFFFVSQRLIPCLYYYQQNRISKIVSWVPSLSAPQHSPTKIPLDYCTCSLGLILLNFKVEAILLYSNFLTGAYSNLN